MAKSLVLHNISGDVVRVFPWTRPEQVWTVLRNDSRRLEVVSSLQGLVKDKVPFKIIKESSAALLEKGRLDLGTFGFLELADNREIAPKIAPAPKETESQARKVIVGSFIAYALLIYLIADVFAPVAVVEEKKEVAEQAFEEKQKEVVKVVRKRIHIPQSAPRQTVNINSPQQVNPNAQADGWKRQGALGALGQLSKGSQRGGLNLGAVKASAGPGLGGTEGSGGVQTSLYGKGLVAAPLGAGHNINGGGGYGTKGKGGGQAGYGTVSLIGSTGASLIPIPEEATVGDGGLDSTLIADVVRRNLGQIRFCYEQGLQLDNALAGRVAVKWTIDASGSVKLAKVQNTTLNNKNVEECILRRLQTWKFPVPEGSQEVPVSYPFLLKRTGKI